MFMWGRMNHKIRYYLVPGLLLVMSTGLFAQLGIGIQQPAQDEFRSLYSQAKELYDQGMPLEALNLADRALQQAMKEEEKNNELKALELIGDSYVKADQAGNGIPYFLRAADITLAKNDTVHIIGIYRKMARAYHLEEVYSKEQEYYEKVLGFVQDNPDESRKVKSLIGSAAFHGGNYARANLLFRELLLEYQEGSQMYNGILQDIITSYAESGKYDSAVINSEILLQSYDNAEDLAGQVRVLNNMGYYYTFLGKMDRAYSMYEEAFEKAESNGTDALTLASMKGNAAVCKTNLGKEREAKMLFREAIGLLEESSYHTERSRLENMLANLYHSSGDLYNAGRFATDAITSAKAAPDPWAEAQAYLTYSNILKDGNDPVHALDYYEQYLAIRDSVEFAQRMKMQALENKRNLLERQERSLQLRLKEEEVSDLAIRQLQLEKERVEKERELLMREKDLDKLKQDSLMQSMTINEQLLSIAQREREKLVLEQEKMMADAQVRKEEAARREAERQSQIETQKARLAEMDLKEEKRGKQFLRLVILGVSLLAIWILISLISTRRKKQMLAAQKKIIEEKNYDLEQKNEEIITQRDEIEAQRNLVFDQKQAIEAYNDEILKSIEYAKRLQAAALPVLLPLDEKLDEYFVFFHPRDVVSGDFYWFAEVENKLVVTVADCTGHGVPGAFMSMMGMSLLKELVQKEYITHPGVILRRLRKEIINTMGQKGISGEQRDGMDMSLISYDPQEKKLDYAGAYNSLYLIRDRKHNPPDIEGNPLSPDQESETHFLYEIPADKMPIAHFDRMDKFRNHEFPVFDGDMVYLFTDGFADQFGGPKGKKFMYKPFKRLLLQYASLPMERQKEELERTLADWMKDIEQVDDICIMGIKL